jgi:hypothetical protein
VNYAGGPTLQGRSFLESRISYDRLFQLSALAPVSVKRDLCHYEGKPSFRVLVKVIVQIVGFRVVTPYTLVTRY